MTPPSPSRAIVMSPPAVTWSRVWGSGSSKIELWGLEFENHGIDGSGFGVQVLGIGVYGLRDSGLRFQGFGLRNNS